MGRSSDDSDEAVAHGETMADEHSRVDAAGPTHTPGHPPGHPGGSPESDLEPGQRVGEYAIEEVIGRGGFGTVYRAVQPLIGKRVAIKVLSRKFSADSDMVSRFVAEARAVNQIRHRHIIDIFSFGQLGDGRHYYVMEHLEGEGLDHYLAARGAIPLAEALPILRAIARALDAAHAKGIAHRDLKPENIFLTVEVDSDGVGLWPKLLDFGIAKLLGPDDQMAHKTGTGVPIGTPYYMSPEQCRGRDVDHRTDIYSFGVLAYRLLTGTFPFEGEMIEILHQQMHDEAPPPSSRNAALSHEADQAIAWMMHKDPQQRPRTVIAAVVALQDDKTPTPMLTPSSVRAAAVAVTTGEHAVPRKRSAWLLALAGIVLAGGGVGGYALTRGGGEGPSAPPADPPAVVAPAAVAIDAAGAAAVAPDVMPDAAQSTHVIVTVTGAPEGTEVTAPGVIGVAPGPVQVKRGTGTVVLVFEADGYLKASRPIVPDRDQPLKVTLKKKRRVNVKSTPDEDPDAIHDPFRKPIR